MTPELAIEFLELEWDLDRGFLGGLRTGRFDEMDAQLFLQKLSQINVGDNQFISRRLVSLLWYIPQFMTWQRERISECHGDIPSYDMYLNDIDRILCQILGVP